MGTTLLTCGNKLVSCGNDFLTCGNDLLTCGNNFLSCGNDLLSHGNKIKKTRKTVLCPFLGSVLIPVQYFEIVFFSRLL